ncbi:MAG TPA: SDR family NAD(P)-dependent oxidoreductase [Chloroflexota bacterium]|jgi:NAD(P)-dependent dehydrogenase (short-subunit alcohol dehydrogenase family)
MTVAGKVAIVTGAGQGIGRYIAHTFADAGANVVVTDISSVDPVVEELKQKDVEVLGVQTDVRNEDQVRALMAQAHEKFGHIDVLVNNAGIVPHFNWGVQRWAKIIDMDQAFWDKVIGTNLGGTFLCTKHVLPYMERQGFGHITTMLGGGSGDGAAAYVVSKDAIQTFTKFVAEEERAAGICIMALRPGGIIAHEKAPEEARNRMDGPEVIGNRFVLATEAPMEMSGHFVDLQDGKLVIADEGPSQPRH